MTFRSRLRFGYSSGVTVTLAVTAGTYEGDSATAVSGVAPLFVHMDCSASTSTRTTKPFREVLFTHDCGDPGGGNYAYGAFANTTGADRNIGYGGIHGHVYKTPGTYSWVVKAYDNILGAYATSTVTVTVRDGSANEWAGGRTLLVSSSGNFTCGGLTGTPDTITTADLIAAIQDANTTSDLGVVAGNSYGTATGTYPMRILFRADDAAGFTANSASSALNWLRSKNGPVYVGSYDDAGVTTTKALLVGGVTNSSQGIIGLGKESAAHHPFKGVVIENLTFDGTLHTLGQSYGIRNKANVRFALVHNCHFEQIGHVAWEMSRNRNTQIPTSGYLPWDGMAMVDCTHVGRNATGDANGLIYNFASRVYVAGCDTWGKGDVVSTYGSHNLRILWGWGIKIEHCSLRYPQASRHVIKMHSEQVLPWGSNTGTGTGAFTPLLNELRRPFDPAVNGYCLSNAQSPIFKCTTSGLTAGTEPVFDTTIGNTTSDGAAVWTCMDPTLLAPNDLSWRTDGNEYATTDVVIDACKFTGPNTPRPIDIGAQDGDDYSVVKRGVITRCWWNCGEAGSVCVSPAYIMGQEWSLYNNAFDISNVNAAAKFVDATILNDGVSSSWGARDVRVYNNDFYASTCTGNLTGVSLGSFSSDVIGTNNVLYLGIALGGRTVVSLGGGATGSNNTEDISTVTTDPGYIGALSSITNWAKSGGYTSNAGTAVPVFQDLFGTLRSGTNDTGVDSQ